MLGSLIISISFFPLTFPLSVELEHLTGLTPAVPVLGHHLRLVPRVGLQRAQLVSLLVEVGPGAEGDGSLGWEAEVVPCVGHVVAAAAGGRGGGEVGRPTAAAASALRALWLLLLLLPPSRGRGASRAGLRLKRKNLSVRIEGMDSYDFCSSDMIPEQKSTRIDICKLFRVYGRKLRSYIGEF